jgi:thiamine biosynthesis protein ThiC
MKRELILQEELKKLTVALVASTKKFIKLSEKRGSMNWQDSTRKAIDNANATLNWHAMEHDKLKRQLHAVSVDCGLSLAKDDYSDVEYNPSAFHKYTYKQRVPLCRQ